MDCPEAHPIRGSTARLVVVVTLSMLAVLAACGDDDADDDTAQVEPTNPTTTSSPAEPSSAEPVCEDGELDERTYILCTAGEQPDQALVVALHGRGSSTERMQARTELDRYAAEEGRAVVYPGALDGGWGDDMFTTPSRPSGDEDVNFLDSLIDELRTDPRVGAQPVGLVGFSNGASMVLRYGSQRPDDVCAVVSVAGQLPRDETVHPSEPMPLLQIYGADDPVRSHDTGIAASGDRQPEDPTPTLSTSETVAAFVDVLAGAPDQSTEEQAPGDGVGQPPDDDTGVQTERWTGEDGTEVILHTITGGGHTWPSQPIAPPSDFGEVSYAIDASAEAVAFLDTSSCPA